MRDSGSLTDKITNNWVLKRKRRKILGGSHLINDREHSSTASESLRRRSSPKQSPEGDLSPELSSFKRKGNDGYYFECVICDVGGNLLCCESCPRTYHIECLNPPLKRVPTGKWHCPNCSLKNNLVEPVTPLDTGSQHAQMKITGATSRKSNTEKRLRISRSSSMLKKKSSGSKGNVVTAALESTKVRTDTSPATESSVQIQPVDGNPDVEEKESSAPVSPFIETSSDSQAVVLHQEDEVSEQDHQFSSHSFSPDNQIVLAIGALARKKKKRKRVDTNDLQEKGRIDDRMQSDTAKNKVGLKKKAKKLSKEGLHLKKKSGVEEVMWSSSEENGTKGLGIRTREKKLQDKVKLKPMKLHRAEFPMVAKSCGGGTINEFQQVDRVLGCRIKDNPVKSSLPNVTVENDSHSRVLVCEENRNIPADGAPLEICAADTGTGVCRMDDHQNATGNSGKDERTNGEVEIHQTYGRFSTKDSKCSNDLDIKKDAGKLAKQTRAIEECDSANLATGVAEENSVVANSEMDTNLKTNGDVAAVTGKINLPNERGVYAEKTTVLSVHTETQQPLLAECVLAEGETSSYEFLVKWVGKSHIHNTWISESQLKVLAKRKLENYRAKYGNSIINICEESWKQPQRVIALSSSDGFDEALVKWTGLSYDECTWEKLDEAVIKESSHLIDAFYELEQQTQEKDTLKGKLGRPSEIVTLTQQPGELKGGSLFPHQLEALNWLRKCWHKSKNVILADEMGLGKTVSACAFISSLYFDFKTPLPCLVLVPLSTMPNWVSEFSLWNPKLNVVEYHGCAKARSIIRQYEWHATDPSNISRKTASYKFHVLLTTYEMVLADSSHLRGVPWEVLVVDEGHRLKNSESKLFSLLNTFSFQHRVLLTGTPLQNNLGEMYNLLNFLQPSSFPSISSFEEKFTDRTTAEKVEELKKLVAPHMLRRLKKDAMQNIPPKTERMVPVELSSIQAEYYRAILTKNYQILRNIAKGVAQQSMLNIVMQLRKVCNHPYLIPGTEPDSGSVEFLHEMRIKASAKLTLLHSMLKVLYKEGHRVLIFSQMTKLLDILEDYITIEFGPKTYERVDGSVSVTDRQAAIVRFNQDKSRFIFLLSTRSCGLGINLASADTVIIYDSDFNPHADIQAMNRAHRIGQSNRLLVYRLVVRASVEERILQLAKKKLMLDQLFVSKSGSQKEVEDILRWGTEELFRDSSGSKDTYEGGTNTDAAVLTLEQRHRKRGGGLGDVYKDKCTDGSNKIVWDDNAIMRLLDRSDLQNGSNESAEGDVEHDVLGSVKSVEWNDDPIEDRGEGDSPSVVNNETTSLEKKEENVPNVPEENEWDKLLRVRWETYQSEEEAALGRGKRQRKAVSYREAYPSHPSEIHNESGGEEEQDPEPEPQRVYTPAGRAQKEKYAKLRTRQKDRLARRNLTEDPCPSGEGSGHKAPVQYPSGMVPAGDQAAELVQTKKEISAIDSENNIVDESKGKELNQSMVSHLSLSESRASRPAEGTSYLTADSNKLLPVLGLCAPNAYQLESSRRNFSKSIIKQSRPSGLEFPFSLAPFSGSSVGTQLKGRESVQDKLKLHDGPGESSTSCPRLYLPNVLQEKFSTWIESGGIGASDFPEQMNSAGTFDGKLPPRFPFPANSALRPSDFLPNLSMGDRIEAGHGLSQDIPLIPPLPNFKFPPQDVARFNQFEKEMLPLPNQVPSTFSPFPDNHRKVLESIMLRTGSGSSFFSRKKSRIDGWSEDELDFLWIGVRRHGRGNWLTMLRDPRLHFSKNKTPEDLSAKWEEEQVKIFDGSSHPVPPKSNRPLKSSFPGFSDEMMAKAMQGNKFFALPRFQSHLTDMKLGYGDHPSRMPLFGLGDQHGLEHFAPISAIRPEHLQPSITRDFSAGPSNRLGTSSNMPFERRYVPNSFASGQMDTLGMDCSSSLGLPERRDDNSSFGKLPGILDRSLNILQEIRDGLALAPGEPSNSVLLLAHNKIVNPPNAKGKQVMDPDPERNKLPHWLREAVTSPPKLSDCELPPTVSAIAQSVRLVYGEDKATIPPFVIPGPAPSRPTDPRLSLKKKRRSDKFPHMQSDVGGVYLDGGASGSTLVPELGKPRVALTGGLAHDTSDAVTSTVGSMINSSSSASQSMAPDKSGRGLKGLQTVASSFVPELPPVPPIGRSNFPKSSSVLLDSASKIDSTDQPHGGFPEPGQAKESLSSDSEDSGDALSNSSPDEHPEMEENSSEDTVSDHPAGDDGL